MCREELCALDKVSLWIPDQCCGNWLGGQHKLRTVVLGDGDGIVRVATNLATLNGEACCSHGVVVELNCAGSLSTCISSSWFKHVRTNVQTLTDSIGCQRNVVLFTSDVEDDGSRVASCKDARLAGAHVLVNFDSAVRQHIKLTVKEVSTRQEANAQNCVICSVGALIGNNGDGIAIVLKAHDLLAKCKGDAVLFVCILNLVSDCLVKVLCKNARKHVDESDCLLTLRELLCKLGTNVASADDNSGLGLCHGVVNTTAISPVLALKNARSVDARKWWDNWLRAGSDYEIVEVVLKGLSRLEILPSNVLGLYICGSDVGGHVNVSASLCKGFWRAVEHLVRIAYVVTYPKSNAARQEGNRVIALKDVDLPIWVCAQD